MELVQTIRATLLHALLGQFVGLAIIGTVILNFSKSADKWSDEEPVPQNCGTDDAQGEVA